MGFYLAHVAAPNDLLIVDEPELNLHPENQRRIARLFARLVNVGIKVFITTHSDYIIKELNTLLMLHRPHPRLWEIAKKEGYTKAELLHKDKLAVFMAEKSTIKIPGGARSQKAHTLTEANISQEFGIELTSFDTTIDTMNRIQEEITWGVPTV